MDAVDYWKSPGEQAQEEAGMIQSGSISGRAGGQDSDGSGSQSSPMVGTGSSHESGSMDTCAGGPSPSYT
jgi:hypothetical protein